MVALTTAAPGLDLQEPGAVAAAVGTSLPWAVVALGLVVAVAARSAQHPFRDWLPATLAAPTAVSALLHAGVVNGGAVLLLRAGGVLDAFPATWLVIVALAAWTMLTSVSAMGVTADTKGVLVRSTQAQTGFLLLTVAAAAPVAAVAHLVGHAAYKAGAFLGVGGVVGARRRAHALDAPAIGRSRPPRPRGPGRWAPPSPSSWSRSPSCPGYDPSPVLAGFAVATAAAALVGWFAHRPDARGIALGLAAATVLVPLYVAGLAGLEAYLRAGRRRGRRHRRPGLARPPDRRRRRRRARRRPCPRSPRTHPHPGGRRVPLRTRHRRTAPTGPRAGDQPPRPGRCTVTTIGAQETLAEPQVGLEEPAPALDLAPAIAAALAVLPPAPPLTELAAVNPLAGLDHLPFATAAHEAARLFGADAYLPLHAYRQAWLDGRDHPPRPARGPAGQRPARGRPRPSRRRARGGHRRPRPEPPPLDPRRVVGRPVRHHRARRDRQAGRAVGRSRPRPHRRDQPARRWPARASTAPGGRQPCATAASPARPGNASRC